MNTEDLAGRVADCLVNDGYSCDEACRLVDAMSVEGLEVFLSNRERDEENAIDGYYLARKRLALNSNRF